MNRYQLTDLRRSVRSSWLIIAILVLSFLGPLVSSLLRSSVEGFLAQNSRRALTADIAVTAYRPIRDDEISGVSDRYGIKKRVREIEFVTMIAGTNTSTSLIEVHAVEAGFPIDGEFIFVDGSKERASPRGGNVWLSSDALLALDLKVGDKLRIGQIELMIERAVTLAPGVSRGAFGFAPRAYMPIEMAGSTGLLGFGSQVSHRVYLETNEPVGTTDEVKEALGDPDLFLRTPDDSIQGVDRSTDFVSLYLAVVSVSLFGLGWAGAFYIIRTQAIERMRSAAVALVFGASARATLKFEFFRIGLLTLLSSFIALAVAYGAAKLVEPLVASVLSKTVSGEFQIAISWRDILALVVTALVSSMIFTLPFAARLSGSKLVDLFQDSPLGAADESTGSGTKTFFVRWAAFITGGLAIVTLSGLSVWLTRDVLRGVQLAASFTIAALVIHFTGVFVFRLIAKVFSRATGTSGSLLRLAGTQLARARFAVRLSFLAIGLSTFVASAIGQIMVSLGAELREGASVETAPDFFLFNIPESELERLEGVLAKENTKLDFVSPMILARIQSANGRPMENDRLQKFPVRITWREKPIASEKIIAGEEMKERFDPSTDELPGISIEARFSERSSLKLGDRMKFDVQGVVIEGIVRNIRRVRWTDFNPNFFISFQGGVLEDAPKTWLGNVRAANREDRARVQSEIVRGFPDLSVIDVSQTLDRLIGLLRAILIPAERAAWLASVFSVLVLLTIVAHSTRLRAKEMNLFRILGAEPRRVKHLYRLEFALASGLGSTVGALGGVALAWFISARFLDLEFQMDGLRLGLTIAVGLILGTALGEWLYSRVSRGLGLGPRVV